MYDLAHDIQNSADDSISGEGAHKTGGNVSFICICLMLSWRPEKTLPPDPAGTARIKQYKRWAGMLLEKAGLQQAPRGLRNVERQTPFFFLFFLGEVHLCENSQAVGSEVVSGLFSYSSTIRTVLALFTSFIALLLTVWEVYSHRFYTSVRLKFAQMSWDHFWHGYFNKGASCCLDKYTLWPAVYSTSSVPQVLRWN